MTGLSDLASTGQELFEILGPDLPKFFNRSRQGALPHLQGTGDSPPGRLSLLGSHPDLPCPYGTSKETASEHHLGGPDVAPASEPRLLYGHCQN